MRTRLVMELHKAFRSKMGRLRWRRLGEARGLRCHEHGNQMLGPSEQLASQEADEDEACRA